MQGCRSGAFESWIRIRIPGFMNNIILIKFRITQPEIFFYLPIALFSYMSGTV